MATDSMKGKCAMFDWENAIALHAMQGNRASSRGEGEFSWIFSSGGISVCLVRCQKDVRPLFGMRREPMAFSRVSTGDSNIPSPVR